MSHPLPAPENLGAAHSEAYALHQDGGLRVRPPRGILRWALVNYRHYPLGRPVRRPAVIRRSLANLAAETGRPLHRWLARSRLVPGLVSLAALVFGRTGQMLALAVRRTAPAEAAQA